MSTLKELRLRIKSVKSTQKITAAMKMVASAKLRKAQDLLQRSKVYTDTFGRFTCRVRQAGQITGMRLPLIDGNPAGLTMILGMASHRGLCGSYTANIAKEIDALAKQLTEQNCKVVLFPFGRKLHDILVNDKFTTDYPKELQDLYSRLQASSYDETLLHQILLDCIENHLVGRIYVVTGQFKSALSQPTQIRSLLPFAFEPYHWQSQSSSSLSQDSQVSHDSRLMEFEPSIKKLLPKVMEHNFAIQLRLLLLENAVCEHAARMSAMDNASKNARDMIDRLQLQYNQGRQSQITNELIEILSGANAAA